MYSFRRTTYRKRGGTRRRRENQASDMKLRRGMRKHRTMRRYRKKGK